MCVAVFPAFVVPSVAHCTRLIHVLQCVLHCVAHCAPFSNVLQCVAACVAACVAVCGTPRMPVPRVAVCVLQCMAHCASFSACSLRFSACSLRFRCSCFPHHFSIYSCDLILLYTHTHTNAHTHTHTHVMRMWYVGSCLPTARCKREALKTNQNPPGAVKVRASSI